MINLSRKGEQAERGREMNEREIQSEQFRQNEKLAIMDLAEAIKDVLSEEEILDLQDCENLEEALSLAFTCLIEEGIEDPEEFLREKGILK